MIPVKLKLSNFTSYADNPPELDFTKFKLAAISGLNGAGKSSLLDAITWCIWGSSRAGDSSDSLIHSGAEQMSVEFSFELDGHIYKVIRKRLKKGGGSTILELWSGTAGSHNLTEGTIKATQEKIINLLHLSFETFTNSSYLRQGHADEFTTKGPTDRKRILADILGLSNYDLLEEKAKEKTKELQGKLQLLEYQTLEIEAELSQKEERSKKKKAAEQTIAQVEEKIKTLERTIKSLQDQRESLKIANEQKAKLEQNLLQNKKELEEILSQGKNRKTRIEALKQELEKLEGIEIEIEKLKDLEKQKKEMEEIRQKRTESEKELSEILGQINLKKQQKEHLQDELEKLQRELGETKKEGAKCPTCGQEIDKEEKIHVHKNLTVQIKTLEHELSKIDYALEEKKAKKIESTLKDLTFDSQKYQGICAKLESLEKARDQKEQMLKIQAMLVSEEKIVSEMRAMFINKKAQVDILEKEFIALPSDLPEQFSKISLEINGAETEMAKLRTEEKEAQGMLGQINELISRTLQLEKLQKQKGQEKLKLLKDKEIYEKLALAFGKKGIQAMIIEGAIPEIEDEANKLLGKLTEDRMKIALLTQRETKTKLDSGEKGIIETLDIIISDEMGERPYEMYSVAGNELVYIRQNGHIKSVPIQKLWSESTEVEYQGEYQLQKTGIEALCYVNGKTVWQKVGRILRHKSPQKIMEVKCGPGNYTVKLTKNHSVYILTSNGLKVKRTKDLRPGDYLLSPRIIPQDNQISQIDLTEFLSPNFIKQRNSNNKPLKWDESSIWSRTDQKINRHINVNSDWGKLIGICVAEGSGQTAYSIAAGTNAVIAQEVLRLASHAFGTTQRSVNLISAEAMKLYVQNAPGVSSSFPKAQYRPSIGGRLITHILKNMVGDKALLKKIPSSIFNSSKEVKLAFLKGLISGDGHLSCYPNKSKSQAAITTISSRLAGELVFLCRQLGIWARIENHGAAGFRRGMNHQQSYRVVISGKRNLEILGIGKIVSNSDGITKYAGIPYDLVGVSRINSKRFPRGVENKTFNCGIRRIPKTAFHNYLNIQNFVQDWNILEVKEISEVEATSEYVYDLMVPGNNSFVAGNGAILVHNSGGEAFRVNFAIRLAISKLLTHRAGAKLQFLVIDEGFGSQDTPGRTRLVETIDAIKNDFEKILVITHIEELKEEFPIRIEVTKDSSGSTFEVVDA